MAYAGENWYARYKLLSEIKDGVYVRVYGYSHRRPRWFPSFGSLPRAGAGYPRKWIKPGEYSPWLKIPRDTLSTRTSSTIVLSFGSSSEVKNIQIELQIAGKPDENAVLVSRGMKSSDNLISFLLPPDLKSGDKLVTVPERIKEHWERAQNLFPSSPAPLIKGIIIQTGLGGYRKTGYKYSY